MPIMLPHPANLPRWGEGDGEVGENAHSKYKTANEINSK